MKKIIVSTLLLLTFALTACGSAPEETQSGGGPGATGALPELTQLIIGTFELEGTEQAVTAEQAADLLPLWQVYQSLSTSDIAAPEEVDALISQIQNSMTAEQQQAIQDMQLTQEDMFTFMQEQGIAMTGPGGQEIDPEQIATAQASGGGPGNGGGFAPPDGGFPGGGGGGGFQGGGGGFPGDGQSLNPDQIATLQAGRPAGGGFNRVPPALVDALIQFLQEKGAS